MDSGEQAASISIRQLGHRATSELAQAIAFVKPKALPVTFHSGQGCKWHLFLDQPMDAVETCAIACGITILGTCGEPPESELIKQATLTLRELQLPSGGWTSWLSDPSDLTHEERDEALVLDTFYSLRALYLIHDTESENFRKGLEWMRNVHNSAEGAWGFFRGDASCTLPTSYALRVLASGYGRSNPVARDVVNRGVDWLLERQRENNDGGWGRTGRQPSSAVHTALALTALVAAGFDKYSRPVSVGRDWLLNKIDDTEHIIDYYITPGRDSKGLPRGSRAINHINFPEGLILQGLLASGANLLDPRLLRAVQKLMALQEKEGYWRCLHAPKDQPIYAIMDGCVALRAFVDEVESHEAVLEVSERIQAHDGMLTDLSSKQAQIAEDTAQINDGLKAIEDQISKLATQVSTVGDEVSKLSQRHEDLGQRVSEIHEGLLFAKPLLWVTIRAHRYPLLFLLVLLLIPSLIASGYSLLTFGQTSQAYAVSSFVVSIVLIVATFVALRTQIYPRDH